MAGFRPFEHMTWAKAVAPGCVHAMHVSGLGPPAPLPIESPDWATWTAPAAALRDPLLDRLRLYLGAPDADGVIVAGASEAIFAALGAHVERGAPVVVESPAYVAIERTVQFLGGVPVHLERREAESWRLDSERLDRLLTESGARVVAITDPHNPTGASCDAATRRATIDVVERHGAILVVDEIFSSFRGPERLPAWATMTERALSLGSMTKGWGLHGLRCGWVMGAPELVTPCRQLFDLLGVNAPSATLALATEALNFAPELDARAGEAAAAVAETFATAAWGGASMARSEAAGIIGFLRLPDGWTSEPAATALRDLDGVQAVPGHFFGSDHHLRIGFDPEVTDGATACRVIAERLTKGSPLMAVSE